MYANSCSSCVFLSCALSLISSFSWATWSSCASLRATKCSALVSDKFVWCSYIKCFTFCLYNLSSASWFSVNSSFSRSLFLKNFNAFAYVASDYSLLLKYLTIARASSSWCLVISQKVRNLSLSSWKKFLSSRSRSISSNILWAYTSNCSLFIFVVSTPSTLSVAFPFAFLGPFLSILNN